MCMVSAALSSNHFTEKLIQHLLFLLSQFFFLSWISKNHQYPTDCRTICPSFFLSFKNTSSTHWRLTWIQFLTTKVFRCNVIIKFYFLIPSSWGGNWARLSAHMRVNSAIPLIMLQQNSLSPRGTVVLRHWMQQAALDTRSHSVVLYYWIFKKWRMKKCWGTPLSSFRKKTAVKEQSCLLSELQGEQEYHLTARSTKIFYYWIIVSRRIANTRNE